MTELFNVSSQEANETMTMPKTKPLESASKFKELSDRIWEQRPVQLGLGFYSLPASYEASAALKSMVGLLEEIDEQLIPESATEPLQLKGLSGSEELSLMADPLFRPVRAFVGTFNRDKKDCQKIPVTDVKEMSLIERLGQTDYDRGVYAAFDFLDDRRLARWSFLINRTHDQQDTTTSLLSVIWHSGLAREGYTGNIVHESVLTEEKEFDFIFKVAWMGGIVLGEGGEQGI